MTTKLLEFPAKKTQIPFEEALFQILDSTNEEARQTPVRNMVIISENDNSYTFHVLNELAITSLLGSMDLVKSIIVMSVVGASDFDPMDEED